MWTLAGPSADTERREDCGLASRHSARNLHEAPACNKHRTELLFIIVKARRNEYDRLIWTIWTFELFPIT